MILSDILGGQVVADDVVIGYVTDVRFVVDEGSADQPQPPAKLYGLVISPHARSSWFGFDRTQVRAPKPIASLIRWRQRGAFLITWDDIAKISAQRIELRPAARRWAPDLSAAGAKPSAFD